MMIHKAHDGDQPEIFGGKGVKTRSLLLTTARAIFQDKGFYGTSVSEISRRCDLSQGTFYQYFKNKEQIFLEIADQIVAEFREAVTRQSREGAGFPERIRGLLGLLLDHAQQYQYFHRILGEFELIDPVTIGYFDSLARFCREFFRRETIRGDMRLLDPNLLAYMCIGMALFQAFDWGSDQERFDHERLLDLLTDLVLGGISGPTTWRQSIAERDLKKMLQAAAHPDLRDQTFPKGQLTKRALFQAAENVFGEVGFNRASISEITRRAGVAQGTFYIHFKSKKDLMIGFVRYINKELRRHLKIATQHLTDRRDIEQGGMLAFFQFLKEHRRIYRVVSESETMGPNMGMWYYTRLAEGYVQGVRQGMAAGEIRDMPPVFLARSLMGIQHMIGLKWLVWNYSPHAEIPLSLIVDAQRFIFFGL